MRKLATDANATLPGAENGSEEVAEAFDITPAFVGNDQLMQATTWAQMVTATLLAGEAAYATQHIYYGRSVSQPTVEAAAKASGPLKILFLPVLHRFIHWWGRLFHRYNKDIFNFGIGWLSRTNTILENWTAQQLQNIDKIGDAFDYLVNTRLYGQRTGSIPDLRDRLGRLRSDVYDPQTGSVPVLTRSQADLRHDVFGRPNGAVPVLERGLAALRDSLYDPQTGWIWRLGRSLDNLAATLLDPQTGQIPRLRLQLGQLLTRLYDPDTGDVPKLRKGLARTTEEADQTANYLRPMEQLVPAAALAPFIATLVAIERETGLDDPGCRSRQRDICAADANGWANLAAALLGGLTLELFPTLAHWTEEGMGLLVESQHEWATRSLNAFE